MNNLLDIKTLIMCAALINFYMCAALYVYSKSHKTYPGFGFWMIAAVLVALTYTLLFLRGIAPDFLTIPIANTIVMVSAIFRLEGMKRFIGRDKFNYWSFWMPALTFVWYMYFTYVENSIVIRNALFSTLTFGVVLWLIYLLRANPWDETKNITNFFIATLVIYSVFLILRAVNMFIDPASRESLTASTPINNFYFLSVLVSDISWSACFILLNGQRMAMEITSLTQQLDKLASIDGLTGIYNRRKFLELGSAEMARAKRYNDKLSLVMFDLNLFKDVNDKYGHAAGDEVLKQVVNVCRRNLRQHDVLGRFGGDEFIILLPETSLALATEVSERLNEDIQSISFAWSSDIKVSISYGGAELSEQDDNLDQMMQRADVLLYEMKYKKRSQSPLVGFIPIC